ncbi:hypothetical protein Hanom_Chr02g00106871 [Helianthus anomalus]
MIQDVILDVKNKIKISFLLLNFTIFLIFYFSYSTHFTRKKINRDLLMAHYRPNHLGTRPNVSRIA